MAHTVVFGLRFLATEARLNYYILQSHTHTDIHTHTQNNPRKQLTVEQKGNGKVLKIKDNKTG